MKICAQYPYPLKNTPNLLRSTSEVSNFLWRNLKNPAPTKWGARPTFYPTPKRLRLVSLCTQLRKQGLLITYSPTYPLFSSPLPTLYLLSTAYSFILLLLLFSPLSLSLSTFGLLFAYFLVTPLTLLLLLLFSLSLSLLPTVYSLITFLLTPLALFLAYS